MRINIDTVPKSYQALFGSPPKENDINDRFSILTTGYNNHHNFSKYEQWTSKVWNSWIINVSENDKIKYRVSDMKEKYNF